jgi:predicted glycosyltransferase
VVKEHLTAVGPRPDDFYKSLAMMTNLILLDPLEPSLDLIRLSKGVATVTGTAGLEAAFLGIPVISFGKHNIYNVVPHVHYMSSWLQIPEAVRSIIENFTSEKETRERDGARFLQAMINISIDCKDVDFNRPLPPELVEGSMDLLDLTLRRN